ncbi:MAG: T9SS type A sorting domain-containing protein [Bacteroidetes bacterium]|nr:T9SS type A sorting domain-containing protein [Bacteroidota bacterium]
MHSCFLLRSVAIGIFLLTLSLTAAAQSSLIHQDGDEQRGSVVENARARHTYFYQRLTWPGGSIPPGARARAFETMQTRPQYQPLHKGAAEDLVWRNIGPDNIGGRIFALALNPLRPETMFVGAADGGVWRSYDAGRTWESVSDDFPTQAMGSIAINPVDTSIIYAATGDASFGSQSFDGAGVMKSTDGGATWIELQGDSLPRYIRASDIAINPVDPDILYLAIPYGNFDPSLGGIWRTKDGGASWELVLTGRMTDIVINPLNPDILYTVSSKVIGGMTADRYGLQKTTDGGDSWFPIDIGVPDSLIGRTAIGICATQPDVVYLGVSEVTGAGRTPLLGIFKTTNAGVDWTKLSVPFDYLIPQGWFDNIIGVHPTNPDIVYAGGVKLIRSSDGGQTWERIADQLAGGILHVDQHEIEFDPSDPDRVYVGNDGGLFLLTDEGRTLEKRDIGMSITQFIGGDMYPGTDAFMLGGTQDNGTLRSNDADPDFELVLYGDGGHGYIHPTQPNVMYTTQERLKLWRSEDFGRTWTWAIGDLPNENSLFYVPYVMDHENPDVLYLGSYRLYRTSNAGQSWEQLQSCPFQAESGGCYYITAVGMAPYDHRIVLAGAPGQVGISTDEGRSWYISKGQLPLASCSAVRTYAPGVMYATFSRYEVDKVWKSTDYGRTWTSIDGDLPDIPVNDIVALDGKLVIGTNLGTYISEDDGTTWQRLTNGMPTVAVLRLRYQQETGVLRAITHGRGIYDMQWKTPAEKAPEFVSRPDTTTLHMYQPFVYAPVVHAWPRPTYRLVEGPQTASIDPVLGIVRWTASDLITRFTIESENSAGTSRQTFTLRTADVISTEWEIVQSRTLSSQVNHASVAADGSLWLARDTAWVSVSTDEGRSWEHFRLPETEVSVLSVFALDRNTAYVGTGGPQSLVNTGSGHVWRTMDGGRTWEDLLYGIDSRFGNIHFWDVNNGIVVSQGAQDSADVFLTSDGGATWQRMPERPYARIPLYNTLTFVDRDHGWFASSNVYEQEDAHILRTVNGGRNWEIKSAGSGISNVSDIAFIDSFKGWFVDEISRRVKRTVAGGQRWISAFYPMAGERLVGVHADPVSGVVWILSDQHAWVSSDEGNSWTKTTLIPAGFMQSLTFADSLRGWAVTKNGIVERQIGNPFVVSAHPPARPTSLALGNAYPNPVTMFSDGVMIPFRTEREQHVTVTLYNAAGQSIGTLLDRTLPPGEHFTTWDPQGVSNGVYFLTLRAGGQAVTGRIVLAR